MRATVGNGDGCNCGDCNISSKTALAVLFKCKNDHRHLILDTGPKIDKIMQRLVMGNR